MATPANPYPYLAVEEYQGMTLRVSRGGMDDYEVDVVPADWLQTWATLRGYPTVEDALAAGRMVCLTAPMTD